MPRISPWDARFERPKPRTLTIPLPELETEITLRDAVDDLRKGQIWDKADTYAAKYVPADGGKPRAVLNSPDGPVEPSRELFNQVAAVEVMQVVPDGEQPFTMIEIVGIAKNLPDRWEEIKLAVSILSTRPKNDPGNSGEVATMDSSASS